MALKVLSIEVGQATTKIVEMDYKSKNPKIYNAFTIETPADVVQDGVIARSEDFLVAIKSEIRRRQIKTTNVVFTVSSGRIANREARIPLCKPKNIMPIITANASDYFPVDMNQYHLVYSILGTVEAPSATEGAAPEKQYRLSLLAVPNDVTTSYIDLSRSLELDIKAIDYVGNSVFQAVRENLGNGTKAILKVEEHSTLITIVSEGEIVLQRQVAHGVNQAIENLMETDMFQDEELTYAGASRKFLENKIIRPHLNLDAGVSSDDANEEDLMVKVMITENLRYLVGNIGRILEYFSSRNEDKQIEDVYLVGLGADYAGLPELLTNELGYQVKAYSGLEDLQVVNQDPAHHTNMRQMAACIGAATNPLQLLSADLLKGDKEMNLVPYIAVMVAGVGIAVAMMVIGSIMLSSAEKETKEKQKKLDSYSYVAGVIDNYDKSQITYNEVVAADHVENWNKKLTAFMNEMETKMPATFRASQFSVTATGVNVGIQVATKPEAAKVIEQFRTFKSVSIVSSSGFSVEKPDGAAPDAPGVVKFSLNLVYTDYYAPEVEETPADQPAE